MGINMRWSSILHTEHILYRLYHGQRKFCTMRKDDFKLRRTNINTVLQKQRNNLIFSQKISRWLPWVGWVGCLFKHALRRGVMTLPPSINPFRIIQLGNIVNHCFTDILHYKENGQYYNVNTWPFYLVQHSILKLLFTTQCCVYCCVLIVQKYVSTLCWIKSAYFICTRIQNKQSTA